MKLSVVVAPVSVGYDAIRGHPQIRGLQDSETHAWPRQTVARGNPDDVAAQMLNELAPVAEVRDAWVTQIERIGFHLGQGGEVELLYTAAIPMYWANTDIVDAMQAAPGSGCDDWMDSWCSLVDDVGLPLTTISHAEDVMEHWRQRLEEQSAALLFLPQYFTMAQLRDVYQSIWGRLVTPDNKTGLINLSNFLRWARRAFRLGEEHSILTELTTEEDRRGIRRVASQPIRSSVQPPELAEVVLEKVFPTPSAVIPVMAASALKSVASLLTATTVVESARVGYVSEPKRRGAPPHWYQATKSEGNSVQSTSGWRLRAVYDPRPIWHLVESDARIPLHAT